MYRNVRAEMARKGFTQQDVVNELQKRGFTMVVPTFSAKLNKKYEFTFAEAVAIKDILGTEMSLEELFKTEGI
jgi:hypothetical protein